MSGNSSRSSARTSPIERWACSFKGYRLPPGTPARTGRSGRRRGGAALGVDALVVDIGAVEGPDVGDLVARVAVGVGDPADLGVAATHRDVVEEDVGVRVAPQAGDVAVEDVPAAGVGAPAHDDHAEALGELREGGAELLVSSSRSASSASEIVVSSSWGSAAPHDEQKFVSLSFWWPHWRHRMRARLPRGRGRESPPAGPPAQVAAQAVGPRPVT